MNETLQDRDYSWFIDNLPMLYQKYGDDYIVIKNKNVIGRYKSFAEGVHNTEKTEEIGTFIVQKCGPNQESLMEHITSMNWI